MNLNAGDISNIKINVSNKRERERCVWERARKMPDFEGQASRHSRHVIAS